MMAVKLIAPLIFGLVVRLCCASHGGHAIRAHEDSTSARNMADLMVLKLHNYYAAEFGLYPIELFTREDHIVGASGGPELLQSRIRSLLLQLPETARASVSSFRRNYNPALGNHFLMGLVRYIAKVTDPLDEVSEEVRGELGTVVTRALASITNAGAVVGGSSQVLGFHWFKEGRARAWDGADVALVAHRFIADKVFEIFSTSSSDSSSGLARLEKMYAFLRTLNAHFWPQLEGASNDAAAQSRVVHAMIVALKSGVLVVN